MSGYVKSFEFRTLFDGDEVKVLFLPLKQADYRDLLQMHRGMQDADPLALMPIYQDLFRRYAKVEGLRDAHGIEVTTDEVAEIAYFIPLVTESVNKMIEAAQLKKQKLPASSGNLTASSPDTLMMSSKN